MEFDNPKNVGNTLQNKIGKANKQGAEVAVIYVNTDAELSVEVLEIKLKFSLGEINKRVKRIMFIYPDRVVSLSREDIAQGKAKSMLLPFGNKK
jgi:hypothetical protein